jgi:LysM repeat protein
MYIRLSNVLIISLLLTGCGSIAPSTPTPIQNLPTLAPLEEATSTATVLVPTLDTVIMDTATVEVPDATDTPKSTDTPPPTPTSGMSMVIVSEGSQAIPPPPQACQSPPQNWVVYIVQRNDTLSSLAQRTGVSWPQIQMANCLAGATIFAGQSLYLPFRPQPLPTNSSPGAAPLPPTSPPPGPGNPEIAITPDSGPPGSTFTFVMTNFSPGENILISIDLNDEIPIAGFSMVADQTGRASMGYISLQDAQPGTYVVRAVHLPKDASGIFTIENPPVPTPSAQP